VRSLVAAAIAFSAAFAQGPPKGTALIVGRVIEAGSQQPVDGAVVTLSREGVPPEQFRYVVADDQGRFLFRNVARGDYSLSAAQIGYLSGGYGKHSHAASSQVLDVADDERIVDLTIRMWKYGAMGGRVVDESGEPIVGTIVRGLLRTIVSGRPVFSHNTPLCQGACLRATTDDRGVYRFSNLVPGEYVVVVPSVTGSMPAGLSRFLAADGRPEAFRESSAGATGWLGGGGPPTGAARPTGDDRVLLTWRREAAAIATFASDGALSIYPTHFFPGVTTPATATLIPVGPGEERSDIDFMLRPVRTVRVSGTLTGPDGPAGDYVLRLVPAGDDALFLDHEIATTASDADGTFTFLGVPPGQYAIRSIRRRIAGTEPLVIEGPVLWADTPVSVGGADVRGVGVALKRGLRVGARVVFEGTQPPSTSPTVVSLDRLDGRGTLDNWWNDVAVDKGGQIEWLGRVPGRYVVRARPPSGWHFKSAMLGGRDISEIPLELEAADLDGIVVTFTERRPASVIGRVLTAKNERDPTATVVVFPFDRARWTSYGRESRRIAAAGTTRHGTFTLSGFPAGEYLIAAVGNDLGLTWRDPAVLAAIAGSATRMLLRDGVIESIDLRATTIALPARR
jgi:hypothetical protein